MEDGSAAAELERFDRVQDAMSRLDGILAAPSLVAAPQKPSARSLNVARLNAVEDPAYDFTGARTAAPNSSLGIKPW